MESSGGFFNARVAGGYGRAPHGRLSATREARGVRKRENPYVRVVRVYAHNAPAHPRAPAL